ncbi:ABC transporter permease [Herpetosiphon geysericola]|uniref:ABC transporter permease n=1 Tax=Herpetosiphon geysericola TaxID=70996 RepID=A0A0P6YTL9_9CHLR|nr:ABC transporter permease [Herpetosiphon geysericola]
MFARGRGAGRQLEWWQQLLLQVFCLVVAVSVLFPIMWIVTLSFKEAGSQRSSTLELIPKSISLSSYQAVIDQPLSKTAGDISFWKLMGNSFFLAAGVSFFSVMIGVAAAYAFSRLNFVGRKFLFLSIGFILLMPGIATLAPLFAMLAKIRTSLEVLRIIYFVLAGLIVTGLILMTISRIRSDDFRAGSIAVVFGGLAVAGLLLWGGLGIDIPKNAKPFDLGRSLYGVGLAMISGALPFAIWNLKGYLDTIPKELEEAAIIDGASPNQIFFRIILPLATPALAVTAFLGFMAGWTEFALTARFINKAENYTLAIALQTMTGQYTTVSWSNFAAMSIMISLPVSIVYLALQKYIVGGLTLGGVKG